ncbi:MAG: Hsp70 family protein, partial [Anaerolineales bacterium]|nr:Hsp70 family protein [Anaerolineales bacterium]
AALYYEQALDRPQNVLIFDFGGGTLDITIMRLGDPRRRKLYANGGIDIAGSDFDRAIIQKRMLPHFGKGRIDHRLDLMELVNAVPDWMSLPELSVPKARLKLVQAMLQGEAPARLKALETLIFNDLAFSFYNTVEAAKINLSSQGSSVIRMDEKNLEIWELYTRYQFEKDIREYRDKIEQVVFETVDASGLDLEQIDAVVKTGGSSNIPVFTEMLGEVFGSEKIKSSNAFSSVTAGLGLRASQSF